MRLLDLEFKPLSNLGWLAYHGKVEYYYSKPGEIKVVRYVPVSQLDKVFIVQSIQMRRIKHILKLPPVLVTYMCMKYPL